MIYLDYNATSPVLPEVVQAMTECLQRQHVNPASQHQLGQEARRQLESARYRVMAGLGGLDGGDELVFTSGATEANNMVLQGMGAARPGGIAISAIEHPSVVGAADWLAAQGADVHRLPVDENGLVDLDSLEDLLATQALRLVSVIFANHETGVVQPIRRMSRLCHRHGVLMHTDATQAVGKVEFYFTELEADVVTFSAHKFQGPVGIGGCLIRGSVADQCQPLLHGGFQQGGLRPGTESLVLATGAARAMDHWLDHGAALRASIRNLRDSFEAQLLAELDGVIIHGQSVERNAATSNVAFAGVDRQAMWLALDHAGIACSTGSACASGSSERSPVLTAMGLPESQIEGALRFSFGAATSPAEVAAAVHHISRIYKNLRSAQNRWKRA